MSKDTLEDVLYFFSRMVIFIPLAVIIVVLFMKLSQNAAIAPEKTVLTPTPDEKSVYEKDLTASSPAKLNLQGPLRCSYSSKESTINAYIKNRNVFAETIASAEASLFLVKGDCLYTWKKNSTSGEKLCEISTFLTLFDTLSQLNILDMSQAFNFLPKNEVTSKFDTSTFSVEKLASACKKEEIEDSIFELPKNVLFKTLEHK